MKNMNEHYPYNANDFPAGYVADESIKKGVNHQAIDSLIMALERMKCEGPVRLERRKHNGRLCWVSEHFAITGKYRVHRVPPPENGEHVERRGRKATGQGWALIAGLPKESFIKRQRTCQDSRAL